MKVITSGELIGNPTRSHAFDGFSIFVVRHQKDSFIPWHYHENPCFTYVLKGRYSEKSNLTDLNVNKGNVIYNHNHEAHENNGFADDTNLLYMDISKEWLRKYDLINKFETGYLSIDNPALALQFDKITKELHINDNLVNIAMEACLLQVYSCLLRINKNSGISQIPDWVNTIRDYIDEYYNEKITLQVLSVQVGLHPVYLSANFEKYFRASFSDYLRSIRLKKSVVLLDSGKHSLAEVAYSCGFSDQSHFNRIFKQHFGHPPSHHGIAGH